MTYHFQNTVCHLLFLNLLILLFYFDLFKSDKSYKPDSHGEPTVLPPLCQTEKLYIRGKEICNLEPLGALALLAFWSLSI